MDATASLNLDALSLAEVAVADAVKGVVALRRWRELDELDTGRSEGEPTAFEACELRRDKEPDEVALAILDAVCGLNGKDGGRVGVDVPGTAIGPSVGRCELLSSATDDSVREPDDGEDAESEDCFVVRPGGGGLSRQSWPSSGEGTKPPDGLGYSVSAGLGLGGAIVRGDGSLRSDWEDEAWRARESMASDESGVELTRLSSGVRLAVERKTASADLRSDLGDASSPSAFAAVMVQ